MLGVPPCVGASLRSAPSSGLHASAASPRFGFLQKKTKRNGFNGWPEQCVAAEAWRPELGAERSEAPTQGGTPSIRGTPSVSES
jgi:hypothetical protein